MHARVFGVELGDELRGIVREPTALFFSVLMPVGFFALFVSLFGAQTVGSVPVATTMIATFGTFGVLSVTLINPGVGIAQAREIGWLRAKRVSAVPVRVTLTAKVVATLPYAIGVLLAMTATAAATGFLRASAAELVRIAGVLLLGAVPFALLGLAIGFRAGPSAAAAILNAILLPSAVLSGLWMPLAILPALIQQTAHVLPTYHLAQLALAQLDGSASSAAGVHVLVLVGTTAVMAALAGLSYRHARS